MKLSSVLKVAGAATLIAGLTPYRVTKDEETGEKKFRALFWEATSSPKSAASDKDVSLRVGFFSPTEKEDEEPHFFADEMTVEYSKAEESQTSDIKEAAAEETAAVEPAEAAGEAEKAEEVQETVEAEVEEAGETASAEAEIEADDAETKAETTQEN